MFRRAPASLDAQLSHPAGKGLAGWWTSLLPADWDHRLERALARCEFPAGHNRVVATLLWECPDDWAVELVGRVPGSRRFGSRAEVVDACRSLIDGSGAGPAAPDLPAPGTRLAAAGQARRR